MQDLVEQADPGPIANPLDAWENDDLLLSPRAQRSIANRYPKLAPIFDWPELRALFVSHNDAATDARARSRRHGIQVVAIGFCALVLTALSPSIPVLFGVNETVEQASKLINVLAAALSAVAVLFGYSHFYASRSRRRWLLHRLWAERARQFHFQLVINNLRDVVDATQSEEALAAWEIKRARELEVFCDHTMYPPIELLGKVERDHSEEFAWLSPTWTARTSPPPTSPEMSALFEVLKEQRFGVQRRYVEQKIRSGLYSPKSRAAWLLGASNALTALIMFLAIATAVSTLAWGSEKASIVVLFVVLSGLASACVIALRVINEGLQISVEAERLDWYLETVKAIETRFRAGHTIEKVEALRDMEAVAYQEMRRFIVSYLQARFVI